MCFSTPAYRLMTTTFDASAWTTLWAQTRHGAIDLSAANPLSEALRTHWLAQIPWLAACTRAADVGSGPAVLPLLLGGLAHGRLDALHWDCLDRAVLPPLALPPRLRLRDGTDFGVSSPDNGPVDALVSSFGLEYVERELIAGACARWLAIGGRLCAVVHAQGSVIDLTSSKSLDDLSLALQHWRIFDLAQSLLDAIACMPADPRQRPLHAASVREAYNQAVDDIKQRMVQRGEHSAIWIDILTALTELARLAAGGQAAEAQQRRGLLADAYAAEALRLRAMRASAVSDADRAALSQSLKSAGLGAVRWQALKCQLGTVGWVLTAQRDR